jgi:hypothetical protein
LYVLVLYLSLYTENKNLLESSNRNFLDQFQVINYLNQVLRVYNSYINQKRKIILIRDYTMFSFMWRKNFFDPKRKTPDKPFLVFFISYNTLIMLKYLDFEAADLSVSLHIYPES